MTETNQTLYVWNGSKAEPVPETEPWPRVTDSTLLAADSWLVADGMVVGLDLHRLRFAAACREAAGVAAQEVDAFWSAVEELLPTGAGSWFPRVELVADPPAEPRLMLRVRPAPERGDAVRVWIPEHSDIRLSPWRKGPDIDRLHELRTRLTEATQCAEVLLVSASGLVLEGTTASLMWWEDDALCVPSPELPVLAGTTSQLILRRAREMGVEVRSRRARPGDLAGREAWLTNALHGIRAVTGWEGAEVTAGEAARVGDWRAWWSGLVEPLG